MRLQSTALSLFLLTQCQMGGGGSNGDPGDPEVRLGAGELVVEQATGNPRLRPIIDADYWLANPYYNWSIRGDQLKSTLLANRNLPNASVTDIAFDDPRPLATAYRSTAPFSEQDEGLIFTRDPHEWYASLEAIGLEYVLNPNTAIAWQDVAGAMENPNVASFVYPPSEAFPSFMFETLALHTTDFWPTTIVPDGPGAAPDGSGSIKGLRVIQHGRCSAERPMHLAGNVSGSILDRFVSNFQAIWVASGISFVDELTAVSFMDQTEDREDAQWGGFLFNVEAGVQFAGMDKDTMRASTGYTFVLADGILSLSPYGPEYITSVAGNSADGLALMSVLFGETTTQPNSAVPSLEHDPYGAGAITDFYQSQDDLQAITDFSQVGIPGSSCRLRTLADGTPSRTILTSAENDPDQCALFRQTLETRLAASGSNVSPPLTAPELATATNTFEESADYVDGAVLHNLRCNPAMRDGTPVDSSDPRAGLCEVVARAKRINTYPDAVELVFFDDEREVTAPAYAIFLIEGGVRTGATALCARTPIARQSLQPRRFTFVNEIVPPPQ